jgi:hypothetical protein
VGKVTVEVQLTEPITLQDLCWLVEECQGMSPQSQVSIKGRRDYNPVDYEPAQITVRGEYGNTSAETRLDGRGH